MSVATITSKGQLTLPREVREHLHVGQGDRVEFVVQPDGTARVQRLGGSALRFYGIMGRPGVAPLTLDEIDDAIARHLTEEDERIRRQWSESEDPR